MLRITAALCVLAVLLVSPPAAAQIKGTVTDENNAPLPAVLVELRGPDGRLSSTLTDALGAFALKSRTPIPGLRLVFTRLGYRTAVLLPRESIQLRMELLAEPLPELVVLTAKRACPNKEDRRGRDRKSVV